MPSRCGPDPEMRMTSRAFWTLREAPYYDRHIDDFRRTTLRSLEEEGLSRSVGVNLKGHKTEGFNGAIPLFPKATLRRRHGN